LVAQDGIEPTTLFTHNEDVARLNEAKFAALPRKGPGYKYPSKDTGTQQQIEANFERSGVGPLKTLALRTGAQVMLIYNVDVEKGLSNGCRGVVVAFSDQERTNNAGKKTPALPIVRFTHGITVVIHPQVHRIYAGDKELCSRKQIPLRLGTSPLCLLMCVCNFER
jgi:ATP-dependent DNA helicase PIF1